MNVSKVHIQFLRMRWPVFGAALGFVLFFLMLCWGVLVPIEQLPSKLFEFISVAVATFVAAWAGGWAAFKAERNTQEINMRADRISAANKAIFAISLMYTTYENLRQYSVDAPGVRNAPDRALKMDSPQPGMMKNIDFNLDELSFLLNVGGGKSSMALMEMMMLEWQYQVLLQTIEHRAKAFEELHLLIQGLPNLTLEGINVQFSAQYKKLEAMTDQLVELIDTGVIQSKEINEKFQTTLCEQFPGQDFLQINFSGKQP